MPNFLFPQSGCYAEFSGTGTVILREPYIPVGSPDQPGYGADYDKFRSDELIKIHGLFTAGK